MYNPELKRGELTQTVQVAIIEKTMSSTNYDKYFDFAYDRFALCSDSSKQKILKRDVDIEIDIDSYD